MSDGLEKAIRPPLGPEPTLKGTPEPIFPAHVTSIGVSKKGPFWPVFEVEPGKLLPLVKKMRPSGG